MSWVLLADAKPVPVPRAGVGVLARRGEVGRGDPSFAAVVIGLQAVAMGLRNKGHWSTCLVFAVVVNALFFNGLRKSAIDCDNISGLFVWQGFSLNRCMVLAYIPGLFYELMGTVDWLSDAFGWALGISPCGISVLVYRFVRQSSFRLLSWQSRLRKWLAEADAPSRPILSRVEWRRPQVICRWSQI